MKLNFSYKKQKVEKKIHNYSFNSNHFKVHRNIKKQTVIIV